MKNPPPNAITWTAVGLIALGLILIYLGWNGAAGEEAAPDLRAQFPYLLSGGIFGLALIGSGLSLVLVRESRRASTEVVAKLEGLTQAVERLAAAQVSPVTPDAEPAHRTARAQADAAGGRPRAGRAGVRPLPPAPIPVAAASRVPPPFERGR